MASSRKDETIAAELTADEWKKLEQLIEIMEIFDTPTFQLIKGTPSLSEVTLLDSRFKMNPFQDGKHEEILNSIRISIICEMKMLKEASVIPQKVASSFTSDVQMGSSHCIWARYKHLHASSSSGPRLSTSAEDEMKLYLHAPTLNLETDPKAIGQYWHNSEHNRLKQLALKYLCIPSTTVSSERTFSTAGAICDVKRNRLDPERVKMLVFVTRIWFRQ